MGFNIATIEKKAAEGFKVPLTVNTFENDLNGEPVIVNVLHVFNFPGTSLREKHQQLMVKVRGTKVKSQGTSEANIWLWKQCVIRVEGYDALPTEGWQALFENNDILRIHAENAITALLSYINAEEGEIVKK